MYSAIGNPWGGDWLRNISSIPCGKCCGRKVAYRNMFYISPYKNKALGFIGEEFIDAADGLQSPERRLKSSGTEKDLSLFY